MKKYTPGFVPINFKLAGKIILAIGLFLIFIKVLSFFAGLLYIPNFILYIGIGLVFVSLYLIFVVSKE